MKKLIISLVVGILILNGFGAVALVKDVEKLDFENINNARLDFTHTVLAEYGTATWCGFCHYAHTALKNIYASGDYPFYYVSLVRDVNIPVCDPRLFTELNLYGYPTVYFDGGDEVVAGGYDGVENDHRAAITTCGNRAVYDIDINLFVYWLGGTEMKIDVSVDNNEASTYDGTIRVYITEIISSMDWKDTSGQLYTFPLLDYAFKDDGTGNDISISAGGTWSDSTTWDGISHGFPSITSDNIMVIAAVFNDEWHQGYAYPPSGNPFDAYYVDETVAAEPIQNLPPEKPTITGPTIGEPGVEYEYTFVTQDPDEDEVRYYIDWGDDNTQGWLGPYPSDEEAKVNHIFYKDGIYEIKAKAKDVNNQESEWSDPFSVRIGNRAPEKPTITGKRNGKVRMEYEYTFITTDPDEDDVSYYIKWGDGSITDWTSFQTSGTPYSENHSWVTQRTYKIEAKTKDTNGAKSDWKIFIVTMPRNKAINTPLLNFLQQHPNLFPILQLLLQRHLGLQ